MISRQQVAITIRENDDGRTYAVAFGVVGVFAKWARLTMDAAERQAQEFADEVRRQRTGRPVIVREGFKA